MLQLMAGAGKVCIDPVPDMYPLPNPRPGRDGKPFVQTAPYDSCYCRAFALSSGNQKALVLCYDLVSTPGIDDFRKVLAEATGVPGEQIYIVATHNHTAPFDRGRRPLAAFPEDTREWYARYEKILCDAGISAATHAVSAMRPARIGYGEGKSYINVNRNLKTPSGCWVEESNPAGFSDKTLAILKFEDMNGKLIAALLNHPTHATCGFKMLDADGMGKTSGNFPGVACRFLEERYAKDDAVVLWTSGASGDQGPALTFGLQMEYPDGYTTMVEYPAGTGALQIEYIGRRHGADAAGILADTKTMNTPAELMMREQSILLPTQKQVSGLRGPVRMGSFGPRPEGTVHIGPLTELPVMEPDLDNPARMTLRMLQVGNVKLLFVNGEMSAHLGKRVKSLRPDEHIVIVSHEGIGIGDIMDEQQVDHKVIQAFGRVVPGACDDLILGAAKQLLT